MRKIITFKNKTIKHKIIFILIILSSISLFSQQQSIFMTEGKLWETLDLEKIGPGFNNWNRTGYGMDYPGYEVKWISSHIGEPPSHHVGGGFWIGALNSSGDVLGIEDFAMYSGAVGFESGSKYIASQHEFIYPNRENYFLQQNQNKGEVSAITSFKWNNDYIFPTEQEQFLPIQVKREVHQWVTHDIDQNYIIFDYTIKNVGDTLMKKTHLMFMYGFSINARGWSILFPEYNDGARNTRIIWDPYRRMMYGYATNFKEEEGDQSYDYWDKGGPNREGEYLAPGYAGIKFLYISPDSTGQENRIHDYGWAASHPTQATHPFTNKAEQNAKYRVIREPANATDAMAGMGDDRWGRSRVWTLVTLGPWDIAPGDSIRITMAELVGAVPYKTTIDPEATAQDIAKGRNILLELSNRAQENFDNDFNIPDPPAAPDEFELEHVSGDQIGARITWSDENESIPDPDYSGDEAYDLHGYKIYRSNYLPIGPWTKIGTVLKNEDGFYNETDHTYEFLDTTQTMGESYYYAITAYDTGNATWPVNPSQYPRGVPPQESSKYVNKTIEPFRAGIGPSSDLADITVVPNPFVIESGLTRPGDEDIIQFVNLPSPCKIRIYTIRGDLVKTINHTQSLGIATWNQVSNWGQYVESGVYIYHVVSKAPGSKGQTKIGKFSIIR